MIQGRRLGRPLLGKWHLCSFVVSVIGLSTLSADSSPREAPPACQLHSIRKPRLLLFTVRAPSSTLLCRLVYIPLKLHRDLSCPPERWAPPSLFSLSLWCFRIRGDTPIHHSFTRVFIVCFYFFSEHWFQERMLAGSFYPPFFIFLPFSYLSPPNKHLCRPSLPNLSLPPLVTLQAGPRAGEGRRSERVSFVKPQNSISGTRTQSTAGAPEKSSSK